MVSPDQLRSYPFFSGLEEKDLQALAMVGDEVSFQPGETIYAMGQPSQELILLVSGSVETYLVIEDPASSQYRKEFFLGIVNEGDTLGLSSLSEPSFHNSTARARTLTKAIRFDSQKLRWEIDADYRLGFIIMENAVAALLGRLQHTRMQLAATKE